MIYRSLYYTRISRRKLAFFPKIENRVCQLQRIYMLNATPNALHQPVSCTACNSTNNFSPISQTKRSPFFSKTVSRRRWYIWKISHRIHSQTRISPYIHGKSLAYRSEARSRAYIDKAVIVHLVHQRSAFHSQTVIQSARECARLLICMNAK